MKICFFTKQNFLLENDNGGCQMSKQLYKSLCDICGADDVKLCIVTTSTLNSKMDNGIEIVIKSNAFMTNLNYIMLRDGYSLNKKKVIEKTLLKLNADLYFFDGSWLGGISSILKKNSKKVIAFYHNIEKELAWDRIKNDKGFLGIPRLMSNWYNEKILTRQADKCICLNDRDNCLLAKNYQKSADMLLPIIVEDKYVEKDVKREKGDFILFVGSYFYPNVQGITWFCNNVMPYIDYKLLIVGNGLEKLKNALECNNVRVIGKVESLNEYYNAASAVVIPIFAGGGMKVKTAEALMYGKYIFATSEALEGYDICGSKSVYCCNSPEEFIEGLNKFKTSEKNNKFSFENRQLFKEKYSSEAIKNELCMLIKQVNSKKV